MKKNDQVPDPLPGDWLPRSPVPPREDEAYWSARLRALEAEAEPVLAEYRRPRAPRVSWLEALGMRWRPAVGGALVLATSLALALVVGVGRSGHAELPTAPQPGNVVLAAVVSGGEPAALWQSAGVQADPVLALLALEGGGRPEGGDR